MTKITLKQYAGKDTDWRSNPFLRARCSLTLLYVGIVSLILFVFSSLVYLSVVGEFNSAVNNNTGITIGQAIVIARSEQSGEITETETEILGGRVVYSIEFTSGDIETEVYIDAVDGSVIMEPEQFDEDGSVLLEFSEGVLENLLWFNVLVVFGSAVLSWFLAGRTLRPIERQMKIQEQFAADAAHELRTPVSAIKAAVDSVLRSQASTEQDYKEVLGDIQQESSRLVGLCEDLLYRTTDHNQITQECNLAEVIDKVCNALSRYADGANITLVQETVPYHYRGHVSSLQRMLYNTIHNAIKFSPQDSQVVVSLDSQGRCAIEDSGIGMNQEESLRMFDRFYQSDQSRSSGQGSGLGMFLVSQIAQEHGVGVNVISTVDQGTTVIFDYSG